MEGCWGLIISMYMHWSNEVFVVGQAVEIHCGQATCISCFLTYYSSTCGTRAAPFSYYFAACYVCVSVSVCLCCIWVHVCLTHPLRQKDPRDLSVPIFLPCLLRERDDGGGSTRTQTSMVSVSMGTCSLAKSKGEATSCTVNSFRHPNASFNHSLAFHKFDHDSVGRTLRLGFDVFLATL